MVYSNTELCVTIDERWDLEVDDARYENGVVMPRVLNKTQVLSGHGDIAHIHYKGKYTVVNVTAGTGAFTVGEHSLSDVTVTADQWRAVPIEVVNRAKFQSFYDPESTLPKDAGKALAEDYDNQLLDLDTNFTSNDIGNPDAPSAYDTQKFLAQILRLRDRSIPFNDLSFILPPIAIYGGVALQAELRDADKTGMPKSILTNGWAGKLWNVPTYETSLVNTTANGKARIGLLIHKSAMAIVMQKNNQYDAGSAVGAGKLSRVAVVSSLFGVAAFRTDHASRVFVAAGISE